MACPYFYPTERMDWPSAPRTPLGAPYVGLCQASEKGRVEPEPGTLRELCNFGYARSRCPHHPADSGEADAVRFDGRRYILEKDYSPFRTGLIDQLEDTRLRRQAAAFRENLTR